jgi:hypothetical protein
VPWGRLPVPSDRGCLRDALMIARKGSQKAGLGRNQGPFTACRATGLSSEKAKPTRVVRKLPASYETECLHERSAPSYQAPSRRVSSGNLPGEENPREPNNLPSSTRAAIVWRAQLLEAQS